MDLFNQLARSTTPHKFPSEAFLRKKSLPTDIFINFNYFVHIIMYLTIELQVSNVVFYEVKTNFIQLIASCKTILK